MVRRCSDTRTWSFTWHAPGKSVRSSTTTPGCANVSIKLPPPWSVHMRHKLAGPAIGAIVGALVGALFALGGNLPPPDQFWGIAPTIKLWFAFFAYWAIASRNAAP